MSAQRTVKLKNLRVADPSYSAKAAQHCTVLAVILVAAMKFGII